MPAAFALQSCLAPQCRGCGDPIAARLLHDIVLDLEAELEGSPQNVGFDAA